jgi:hypothetical protein
VLRKDIWRPALVEAPIAAILERGSVDGFSMRWLPSSGSFQFLADPFGLWRDGRLHVFVERYDYRVRIGTIEVLVYARNGVLIDRAEVLAEAWHLSYPYVFEADGDIWMLPEAHRSGHSTLYRATAFPYCWEAVTRIVLDTVPIDATPVFHGGRWWLFYAGSDHEDDKMTTLHAASAPHITGPWQPYPGNPVRRDPEGARPGGTPVVIDGRLMLPVQDCSHTYGGAIRPLILTIGDRIESELGARIVASAGFAPFTEGLHTLATCGEVTLVDVKRTELSPRGIGIEIRREARKRLRCLQRTS